jgi:hypothetical protein
VALIDLIASPGGPQSVYLFPTPTGGELPSQEEALFFPYWPQSHYDDYQVSYVEHIIPGGTHPLYQWVGGAGRTLTFQAVFTSELNTNRLSGEMGVGQASATAASAIGVSLLPSTQYTVDVSAALNKVRAWQRPSYGIGGSLGAVDPPKILTLAFPGTKLNGTSSTLTVILKSAPITIESWFPDGQIRVATVDLTFNEVVQTPSGDANSGSKINFRDVDRRRFIQDGQNYRFRGLPDRPFAGA